MSVLKVTEVSLASYLLKLKFILCSFSCRHWSCLGIIEAACCWRNELFARVLWSSSRISCDKNYKTGGLFWCIILKLFALEGWYRWKTAKI